MAFQTISMDLLSRMTKILDLNIFAVCWFDYWKLSIIEIGLMRMHLCPNLPILIKSIGKMNMMQLHLGVCICVCVCECKYICVCVKPLLNLTLLYWMWLDLYCKSIYCEKGDGGRGDRGEMCCTPKNKIK